MRRFIMVMGMAAIAAAAGLTACHKTPAKQQASETVPLPGSPEEVIMKSGEKRVTMDDYNHCIALHRFHGRYFSKRALANHRFQDDEARRCFQIRMMKDYAAENGLTVDRAAKDAAIEKAMALAEVDTPEKLMKKIGVNAEELDELAGDYYLQQMLQKSLVGKLTSDQAWDQYRIDARSYTLDLIDFPNEPTDEEIASYAKTNSKEIALYVSNNPHVLNSPPRAHFVRLGYPKNGGEEDMAAYRNTERLRDIAVKDGAKAAIEACRAKAAHGCIVMNDTDRTYIEERSEDNAWAFRMPVGGVSGIVHGDVNEEIWLLHEIEPPAAYDLKDPAVKKMLVRKAMTATTSAPHLLAALKPALEAPNPDLKKIAEENGGKSRSFTDVPYAKLVKDGAIESPVVMHVLAQMKPEESRLFSNPIVDRGRVYVFYVSQMKTPTREDFVEGEKKWRKFKEEDPKTPMTRKWLENNIPSMSTLNLKPIEAEYGILQVNGTIR